MSFKLHKDAAGAGHTPPLLSPLSILEKERNTMFRTLALTAVLLGSVAIGAPASAADASYTTTTNKTTTTTNTYQGSRSYSNTAYRDADSVAVIPTLKLGAGYNDVFDGEEDGAAFRGELHSTFRFLDDVPVISAVHPFVGADTTNHGGAYVYGGVAADVEFAPQWVLTPSLAAGYYNQGGAKDIGTEFALRPGVEVAYRFQNEHKIGVEVTDTMGVTDGSDEVGAVTLNYHMPFGVMGTF